MASLEERTKKFEKKIQRACKEDVRVTYYINNSTTAILYFPSCKHSSTWHPRNKITEKGIECGVCYPYKGYQRPKPGESFADKYPELAEEWSIKNDRKATEVTTKSGYEAIFDCTHCKTPYKKRVAARVRGDVCEHCLGGNNLKKNYPFISSEYILDKNDKPPEQVSPYSSSFQANWRCSTCSNEWSSTVYDRTKNKVTCSVCSKVSGVSYPELQVYKMVSSLFPEAEHQPMDLPEIYHVDILLRNEKVAIEYDGFYSHIDRKDKDIEKNRKLKKLGYTVIRIRDLRLPRIDEEWDINIDMTNLNSNRWKQVYNQLSNQIQKAIGKELTINKYTLIDHQFLLEEFMSRRSLTAKYPEIAKLFNSKVNKIGPERISPGSERLCHWLCPTCNHEWKKSPYKMIDSKIGCPKCSSAGTKHPELLDFWDFKNNEEKSLYNYLPSSTEVVKWICSSCRDSYPLNIKDMAKKKNKVCSNCYDKLHQESMYVTLKEYMPLDEITKRKKVDTFIKLAQPKYYNNCCPKCDSKNYKLDGHYDGEQRYKCKGCNYNFTSKTVYSPFGIKRTEKLPLFFDLINKQEKINIMTKKLGVNKDTVIRWKKIFDEFLESNGN